MTLRGTWKLRFSQHGDGPPRMPPEDDGESCPADRTTLRPLQSEPPCLTNWVSAAPPLIRH